MQSYNNRVWLFAAPWTAACQTSLWLVSQSCPTPCDPWTVAHQVPLSMGILQARILKGLSFPSPGDLPNPGIKPRSPTLQADSLPSEPPGKPKNTRVGSSSLLQVIFLTQESNWGLLHCRQILYQLSYEGKIEGKRRRGQQRMRWLYSITDSADMSFSKLHEIMKDRLPMDCRLHYLLESVMPSKHLILCCPLALLPSIFPSIGTFSNNIPRT